SGKDRGWYPPLYVPAPSQLTARETHALLCRTIPAADIVLPGRTVLPFSELFSVSWQQSTPRSGKNLPYANRPGQFRTSLHRNYLIVKETVVSALTLRTIILFPTTHSLL